MASDNDASCVCDPNFAIICSFLEKFGKVCGITYPNIKELQEMLENTLEVPQALFDLQVKLLRKVRRSVHNDRWERALVKFCHSYSSQDAWEIERFGYKKSRLSVKLRALKALLEAQFDNNQKFKNEVNKMSTEDLRLEPIGKDKKGLSYWYQVDEVNNLRVYREDPDEETWELVASDRAGLVQLISELSAENNTNVESIMNEDSNSLEIEKPITDTGQPELSNDEENSKDNSISNSQLSDDDEPELKFDQDDKSDEDENTFDNSDNADDKNSGSDIEEEEEEEDDEEVEEEESNSLPNSDKKGIKLKLKRENIKEAKDKEETDEDEMFEKNGKSKKNSKSYSVVKEKANEKRKEASSKNDQKKDQSKNEETTKEDKNENDASKKDQEDNQKVAKEIVEKNQNGAKSSADESPKDDISEKNVDKDQKENTSENSENISKAKAEETVEKSQVEEQVEAENKTDEDSLIKESSKRPNDESDDTSNTKKLKLSSPNRCIIPSDSKEVSETIVEDTMIIQGEGSGENCETANIFLDSNNVIEDEIVEEVMYFYGEGNGADCMTANSDKSNSDESCTKESENLEKNSSNCNSNSSDKTADCSVKNNLIAERADNCDKINDELASDSKTKEADSDDSSKSNAPLPATKRYLLNAKEDLDTKNNSESNSELTNQVETKVESKSNSEKNCLDTEKINLVTKDIPKSSDCESSKEAESNLKATVDSDISNGKSDSHENKPEKSYCESDKTVVDEKSDTQPMEKSTKENHEKLSKEEQIETKKEELENKVEQKNETVEAVKEEPKLEKLKTDQESSKSDLKEVVNSSKDIKPTKIECNEKIEKEDIKLKEESNEDKKVISELKPDETAGVKDEKCDIKIKVCPVSELNKKVLDIKKPEDIQNSDNKKLEPTTPNNCDNKLTEPIMERPKLIRTGPRIKIQNRTRADRLRSLQLEAERAKNQSLSTAQPVGTPAPNPLDLVQKLDSNMVTIKKVTKVLQNTETISNKNEVDPLADSIGQNIPTPTPTKPLLMCVDINKLKAKPDITEPAVPEIKNNAVNSKQKVNDQNVLEEDPLAGVDLQLPKTTEVENNSSVANSKTLTNWKLDEPEIVPSLKRGQSAERVVEDDSDQPNVKRLRPRNRKPVEEKRTPDKSIPESTPKEPEKPENKSSLPRKQVARRGGLRPMQTRSSTNTSSTPPKPAVPAKPSPAPKNQSKTTPKSASPKNKQKTITKPTQNTETIVPEPPPAKEQIQTTKTVPKSVLPKNPPKEPEPKKKVRKLLGLEVEEDLVNDEGKSEATPIRQSRRIAQIKIREEAERRKLEEIALGEITIKKPKKNKEVKDSGGNKKKKNKYSEDEDYTVSDVEFDKKKKKKKKKKGLKFDESNPWKSSSGSSSSNDEEEDDIDIEPIEEATDDEQLIFKSDHEFSPESDLGETEEVQPLRRARTAKVEKIESDEEDDYACQKCGKSDHPEWILLCDSCDCGWHCSCLRPALLVIPEGDWFCPPCQHTTLISRLKLKLDEYDKQEKKMEHDILHRQRLEYVGISMSNVLPPEHERKSKSRQEYHTDDSQYADGRESRSAGSASDSGSESRSGSDDSSEPIYQLRQRRQANSYRFNEYDDLINSAIQDELDAVKGAGNQGRGKDISTIVNAEKEEAELERKKAEAAKAEGGEVDGGTEAKPGAKENALDEEIPPVVVKKKSVAKKKHTKLTSLDIDSEEDDAYSDEDFKGSSSEDEEEFEEEESGSDDSDIGYGRSKRSSGPVRRSSRKRATRYDTEFINDDSEDEELPKKKKSRSIWDESESESDGSWGGRKKRSRKTVRRSPKPKKSSWRPKKKNRITSDNESEYEKKPKKPKIKYGGLSEPGEEDISPQRRTRGKKINYLEALGSESEEEIRRTTVKPLAESEDEYVVNEDEEEDDDDEELMKNAIEDSEEGSSAGEIGQVKTPEKKREKKENLSTLDEAKKEENIAKDENVRKDENVKKEENKTENVKALEALPTESKENPGEKEITKENKLSEDKKDEIVTKQNEVPVTENPANKEQIPKPPETNLPTTTNVETKPNPPPTSTPSQTFNSPSQLRGRGSRGGRGGSRAPRGAGTPNSRGGATPTSPRSRGGAGGVRGRGARRPRGGPSASFGGNPAPGAMKNPAPGTMKNPSPSTMKNPAPGTMKNPAPGTTKNPMPSVEPHTPSTVSESSVSNLSANKSQSKPPQVKAKNTEESGKDKIEDSEEDDEEVEEEEEFDSEDEELEEDSDEELDDEEEFDDEEDEDDDDSEELEDGEIPRGRSILSNFDSDELEDLDEEELAELMMEEEEIARKQLEEKEKEKNKSKGGKEKVEDKSEKKLQKGKEKEEKAPAQQQKVVEKSKLKEDANNEPKKRGRKKKDEIEEGNIVGTTPNTVLQTNPTSVTSGNFNNSENNAICNESNSSFKSEESKTNDALPPTLPPMTTKPHNMTSPFSEELKQNPTPEPQGINDQPPQLQPQQPLQPQFPPYPQQHQSLHLQLQQAQQQPPQLQPQMQQQQTQPTPPKRRGRGKGKKTLAAEAAAAAAKAAAAASGLPSPAGSDSSMSSSNSSILGGKLGIAPPPQPFSQAQPTPSVITRMLQSQPVPPQNFTSPLSNAMGHKFFNSSNPNQPMPPFNPRAPNSNSFRPPISGPPMSQHYPVSTPPSSTPPPHRMPVPPNAPIYHTAHHPLDPSPSGGGSITIANTPVDKTSPSLIPPTSGSPISSKNTPTPPPPPYSRLGIPPTPMSTATGPPPNLRHHMPPFPPTSTQLPPQGSPYHPPPHPGYHYGAYPPPPPLGTAEDSLPPPVYQGSPYPTEPMLVPSADSNTSLSQPISDSSNSKPFEEDTGGEFGGLVSYFSSQREDDIDT